MNRREILKSFLALPFVGKSLLKNKIPLSSEVLPPTGTAEAINNIIPNINITGIPLATNPSESAHPELWRGLIYKRIYYV